MSSILDVQVSLFYNYYKPKPADSISLLQWVEAEDFRDEILALRKERNPKRRKELKQKLPAITPSALIVERRKIENVVAHSGFVCLDIDSKDNPSIDDWEALKDILMYNQNIAYAGLSASGNGLFVLVCIKEKDKHEKYINALEYYFMEVHGIVIDKACKDVTRLRGASYDDDPHINHHAVPMQTYLEKSNSKSNTALNNSSDRTILEGIVKQILSRQTDITDSYHDWFRIGCVIANICGESGRDMYHDISKLSNKYSKRQCNKKYSSCLQKKYPYTIGTLIHIFNIHK